jgi:hypothetical protein
MKVKIKPSVDSSIVGLLLRFENKKDTTVIAETFEKALKDCGITVMKGIFKNEIYEDNQYKMLFKADSVFLSSQPTLTRLNQLLVVDTHVILKKDDQGKNSVGVVLLARWISLSPIYNKHSFYYAEKMSSTGSKEEVQTVTSFLAGQVLAKLCYEIKQHIFKTK